MVLTAAFVSLALTGCAPDPASNLDCKVARESGNGVSVTAEELANGARAIAEDADQLRTQLSRSPSMAGFSGSVFKRISGTDTYTFAAQVAGLREKVARQVARQQAYFNDGDTLLPTTKDWSCRILADSVASLELGQSSDQLIINLKQVNQHFEKAANIFSKDKNGE